MSAAIRSVVNDLVERRLWPVAVILVAAAIAIPVLLAKPASNAPPPTNVAGSPPPALGTPAVNLADPAGGPVVGGLKNPFRQQHVPRAAATTSASTSALGPAKPGGGSGATSGGTGAQGAPSGGGGTSGGSSPSKRSGPTTVLEVRFGLADGKRTKREVTAGSPLPSPTNPLLVYLGQTKDGKQAAFLVSSDAQPQGDGRCAPDKSICSTLYMKTGQTEFFDVTGPTGTVQYELEVLRVTTRG